MPNSIITGSGTLVANGAISGGGLIIAADSGTIDITGTGSIASDVVLDFSTSTTLGSTLRLDLSGGVTSAANIRMNNANQSLIIGPSTSLTINAAEVVSKGTLRMLGGTVTDTLGITVGGQGATGTIVGFGTIAANVTGGGVKGVVDTITASGGTLDLTGVFTDGAGGTFVATIDSASPSTLKFDNTATVAQPIAMSSANQTLEIGAAGALTLTGLEIVGGGTIRMDGGTLTDVSGIGLNAPAVLVGKGTVTAGTVLSGDGTVKASGGTLELGAGLTATTMAFDVDTVAGSVLRVDGAVAPGVTLSFLGSSGTLELADVVGGVLQGFGGTIAGLNVGPVSTSPTNELNVQAPITKAVVAGSTLTLLNGATTVATLALSAAPVAGTYAVIQADAGLGGSDVFLTNAPPGAPGGLALAAASDSGAKGDGITNIAAAQITGKGVAGDTVTLLDGATTAGSAIVDAAGNWSVTAALTEGANLLTATQTDAFSNVSAASNVLTVTLDTVAPVVAAGLTTDTGSSGTDHVTSKAALSGTADPGGSVTVRNGATVLGSTSADAKGAWSFTPAGLVDGGYVLVASDTDTAGNTGTATVSFTLDTAAPTGPATPDLSAILDSGSSSIDNVTSVVTPSFTGTAEAGATITLFDGATPVGTGKADSLGNWSVSASALANGQHSISAKATDLAGNVSPGSAALTVTIDTVAPAAPGTPTLTAASDSGVLADNITNVTAPTLAGTAEAGATVTLREGATVLGSGKADAAGAWTIASSPLTNGKHAITATASDAAGNASLASAALSVTIDNAPPAAPGVSQVTATAIAGTAEANASVALFDGAAQIGTAAADAGGAWSLPFVLAAGSHTLTAKATDLAGNVGAASPALAAIIGTAGNDALVSGTGITVMIGGAGNDTYTVKNSLDVVTEAAGGGTDTVRSSVNYTLAAEIETLAGTGTIGLALTGNAIANTITGTTGNDTLNGGGGNDVLSGGAGADSMSGGTGNDTYIVDNALDQVIEAVGGGTDSVNTSVSYTLAAGSEIETLSTTSATGLALTGNEFANTLIGAAGNDTLTGGAGDDKFRARAADGNDTYDGGIGNDTYDLSLTTAGATVNLGLGTATSAVTGTDTLISIENVTGSSGDDTFMASVGDGNNVYNGGAGNDTYDLSATTANAVVNLLQGKASSLDIGSDTLSVSTIEIVIGGTGNDTLTGDTHANVLVGGAGNDALSGGLGADTMTGGAGNDTYTVDNVADVVNENPNEGNDTVVTSVSYTLGAELENLTGSSAIGLALDGNDLDNRITSGAGNDTMSGGLGNDTYFVNSAGDVVSEAAAAGTDTVWSSVNYTLIAGSEVETLRVNGGIGRSLTGNDLSHNLLGGAGNDTLNGGVGDDTLNGSAGADVMSGGGGNDTYFVDNIGDAVHEAAGGGTDTVLANVNYTLTAGSEIEFLRSNAGATGLSLTGNNLANAVIGAAGNNSLSGGGGDDALTGGGGNDTLVGGAGNDTLTGNAGNDVFSFVAGFGKDTITDFAAGTVVGSQDLIDISGLGITATTFAASVAIAAGAGGSTVVTIGANSITLAHTSVANITQSDFLLAP